MGLFGFGSSKQRCPKCGHRGEHTKVVQTKADKNADAMMREMFKGTGSMLEALSEDSRGSKKFKCEKCAHPFSLDTAERWQDIAKKFGEKTALDEYHDVTR